MTQQEFIGFGSINSLPSILAEHAVRRVLLVTGRASYRSSAVAKDLTAILRECRVFHFDGVTPNPQLEELTAAVGACAAFAPDLVIAVGGGSVIDIAKMINFFISNPVTPREWIGGARRGEARGKPLVAIPTTAGSGSEATHFAVLYAGKDKQSVEDEALLPDVAIIDPAYTAGLPPYETAVSGVDALAQAIESYWSIRSTEESQLFAREALTKIVPNIVIAATSPTPEARLAMAWGAHLAGKAIRITKTTAAHSVSYPITSYFGVPHGHAVGLVLPSIFQYNCGVSAADVADPRGIEYVRQSLRDIAGMVGADSVEKTKDRLVMIIGGAGLETDFYKAGIRTAADVEIILQNGFTPDRVKNNPRKLTREALRRMLSESVGVH